MPDPLDLQIWRTVVLKSLQQLCGGDESVTNLLEQVTQTGISVQRNLKEGTPHDVQIRVALKLFHQLKHLQQQMEPSRKIEVVTIISDMDLKRSVTSPFELAEYLLQPLEFYCRERQLYHNLSLNNSGLILGVTGPRVQFLLERGKVPCRKCWMWCKGSKGLWWHQQQAHGMEHSVANSGNIESMECAIVVYQPHVERVMTGYGNRINDITSVGVDSIFDLAKEGNLNDLTLQCDRNPPILERLDRRGASVLHWAAGAGHLKIVSYLLENHQMDANQPQQGKRGFAGRTPLHWAARNGHLQVVKYLVEKANVYLEATTIDGTTAFGWAAWQGHLGILQFLHRSGADPHARNAYGCNAVLWLSQSDSCPQTQIKAMQWFQMIGVSLTLVNSNGHGVLHKAAQRGRSDLVEWFVSHVKRDDEFRTTALNLIGPDSDHCLPSDLAGMAGHEELARELSRHEAAWIKDCSTWKDWSRPNWLLTEFANVQIATDVWEPHAGILRLQRVLEK